jgi:hypothetical protein
VLGGGIALLGVIVNARWTRKVARDERTELEARASAAADAQFLAAKRLVLTDLERTAKRMESTSDRPDTKFHWLELPRGAWLAHRTLLANRLDETTWWAVAEAYNSITDWNDLVAAGDRQTSARRANIHERHPIVATMAVRAISLLAPGVADEMVTRQRTIAVPVLPPGDTTGE